jgi:hypothetical protein
MAAEKKKISHSAKEHLIQLREIRLSKLLLWPIIIGATILAVVEFYQLAVIPNIYISLKEENIRELKESEEKLKQELAKEREQHNAPKVNMLKGSLTVTYPEEESSATSMSRLVIKGVNSDAVTSIKISFRNNSGNLQETAVLPDFSSGDLSWGYLIDTRYKNFWSGVNEYTISAYAGDTLVAEKTISLKLVGYTRNSQEDISVDWLKKLKPHQNYSGNHHDEPVAIDGGKTIIQGQLYEAGTVADGDYKGDEVFLLSASTMGVSLYHLIQIQDKLWNIDTLGLHIVDIANMPEIITMPNN